MLKVIREFTNKDSTFLGAVIFILSLALLTTGIEAITAGNYIRAIADLAIVFFAQYDFWTKWRHKVDV